MKFLLYGAYGYTGELIARYCKQFNLTPILAGRNEAKLKAVAEKYGYPYQVFDLSETGKLDAALREVPVVLHAAGPFVHTARPMMEACLRTGTHYLDITGEIAVFETAYRLDNQAKSAGVMLLPGAGFDVVPTDCLALYLKNKLPDATHLKLAFAGIGAGVSHGTALTMAENLGAGGAVRTNGKIVKMPLGHKTLRFPAGEKQLFAMTIPWGDVSTAYHSTGIPNIEVYTGVPPSTHKNVQRMRYLNWLLRTSLVKNFVRKRIHSRPAGPPDEHREKGRSYVWGEVKNASGDTRQATLETPEGYTLTALSSLIITKKVLEGNFKTGFQTPAKAYGADLVMEVGNVSRVDV